MAGELTIEVNTDGSATINFPGGGSHTADSAGALKSAYGDRVGNTVSSNKTRSEQIAAARKAQAEQEAATAPARAQAEINKINETEEFLSGLGLTDEQYDLVMQDMGRSAQSESYVKIHMTNVLKSMALGGTFEQARNWQSGDSYFYTKLREGYEDPNWPRNTDVSTMGGKVNVLNSYFTQLNFGVVGSSQDTRNYRAAITSGDAVNALRIATSQMYGGTTVSYEQAQAKNEDGSLKYDSDGKAVMLPPNLYLKGGNGQILTSVGGNQDMMVKTLRSFGVRDLNWSDQVQNQFQTLGGNEQQIDTLTKTINFLKEYDIYGSTWKVEPTLWDQKFADVYTPPKTTKPTTTTQPTSQEEGQTITSPVAETVEEATKDVTKPVYEETPKASEAVPVTPTTYTPTPTTVTGQTVQTGVTGTGIYPQAPVTGTMSTPLQTAGLSSVPQTVQVRDNYTGTTMSNLTSQSQGGFGGLKSYSNQFGNTIQVTEDASGNPLTYVPPGYSKAAAQGGLMTQGYSEGGPVEQSQDRMLEAKHTIAKMRGYKDIPKTHAALNAAANANEGLARAFRDIGATFNQGGYVQGYNTGGLTDEQLKQMQQGLVTATMSPQQAAVTQLTPEAADFIAPTAGQATAVAPMAQAATVGTVQQAQMPMMPQGTTYGGGTVGQPGPMVLPQGRPNPLTVASGVTPPGPPPPGMGFPAPMPQDLGSDRSDIAMQRRAAFDMQGVESQPTDPAYFENLRRQAEQSGFPAPPPAEMAEPLPTQQQFEGNVRERMSLPFPARPGVPTQQPGQAAATVRATTATPAVQQETARLQAAQGAVSDQAQVTAAQQDQSAVSGMEAAQGQAIMMENPVQREIQEGELISGAANAEKAAKFTEQIEAATATPSEKATVQGQLEGLMQQFEGGETPAWAAGSMRAAMSTLAARGLSASSMAGQAVIQAAMEAALPIAQQDAQTQAQFESQNLSNRQQRAMLAAQQRAQFLGQEFDQAFQARVQNSARIGDIANMNFTAEQNIALENSRAANTMNLSNLSNRQAMVMAEAAALANLDMANLNNRQQAAVQNAQSFLQMDMQNLNNLQQTALFKSQQNIQALLTDQAAENAASQFNATSENQTNQFFASLSSQVSQFNASQQNAMDQFNVNATNAMRQFNSQQQQQRDLFNAQNGLVVAQANAQWRQNIATINTAAQNESNMDFAQTINALTAKNLDELWQKERDLMDYTFRSSESAKDRALNILLADKKLESVRMELEAEEDAAKGSLWTKIFFGDSFGSGLFG